MNANFFDQQLEQAVLAGLMIFEDVGEEYISRLEADDFTLPANRTVFETIRELIRKGQRADMIVITHELRRSDRLDGIGGPAYLASIFSVPCTTAMLAQYAATLKSLSIRRKLYLGLKKATALIGETAQPIEEIVSKIEGYVLDSSSHSNDRLIEGKDLMDDLVREIEKRGDPAYTEMGVKTGFRDLDEVLQVMRPGQLIVVAAQPGMGKTSFAINVAADVVLRQKKACLIHSLEMTSVELGERFVSSEFGVPLGRLKSGNLSDAEFNQLFISADVVCQSALYIDDSSQVTPFQIQSTARRVIASLGRKPDKLPLGLIVVDYIQIMKSGERAETNALELANITSSLKRIAKELNVPVIALSQLSREGYKKKEGQSVVPQLGDLKGSGAIEADADVVLMLHKENDDIQDSRAPMEAKLKIAKNRHGPQTTISLLWNGATTRFEDFNRRESEPAY